MKKFNFPDQSLGRSGGRLLVLSLIASLSLFASFAFGQPQQANKKVKPYVSKTPLSSLPKASLGGDDAPPLRQGGNAPVAPHGAHQPDPLWQRGPKGAAPIALGVTPDEFAIANPNFPGISGGNPPDTNGAVGPNHYIQTSNSGRAYQIWDKQGNSLAGPTNFNQIWIDALAPAADDCRIGQRGDPYVSYDHLADRWVLSQFANNRSLPGTDPLQIQCIAVSRGPDPVNDGWYAYTFDLGFSNDYPKLAIWPDGYYYTSQRGYNGNPVDATVFDRATMLNGGAATFQTKSLGGPPTIVMLPSELQGPPPPAGSPNYYVRMVDGDLFGGPDRIEIREFHTDWGVPANTTFGNLTTLLPSAFSSDICDGASLFNYCIDQPGSIDVLETLSVWPMVPANYRNFGDYESIVFNHSVDVDGNGLVGIRWYELRRTGGVWTLYQEGTYSPPDGTNTHRWMGSISQDKAGNMALGYSVSNDGTGTNVFPGIRYTGRLATDPLGLMPAGEFVLAAGAVASGTNDAVVDNIRWGDYSTMRVDPVDGCTFWYTTHYNPASGSTTRIGAFRFPSCNPVDLDISKADSPDPVIAGAQLNYTVYLTNHGPATATNVVVTDTLPAGVTFLSSSIPCTGAGVKTCPIGTLLSGAVTSFSIQVRVPANFLSSIPASTANIINTVSVTSDQQDSNLANNTATATTNVIESSDLRVTKTCKPDGPAPAGSSAYCQLLVDNLGLSDAQNVTLTDNIVSNAPFTVTSISVSPSGTCLPATPIGPTSNTTITCDLGIEPASGTTTIQVNFTASGAADVNDTADVSSTTTDPNLVNNHATGKVIFVGGADLAITKSGPPSATAGTNLTYTLNVTNIGPSPAVNIVMSDLLPPEVDFVSHTTTQGACSQAISTVTCTLGTLANAAVATVTITVKVKATTPDGTVLLNRADVSSDTDDPNNGNNSANAVTTVGGDADLSIVKNDFPDPVLAGNILTYEMVVTNNGPSTALNVALSDTLPPQVTFQGYTISNGTGVCTPLPAPTISCNVNNLNPGQFVRVVFTVLVGATVPNGTVIVNSASVSSSTPDSVPGNNTAMASTTVNARADLILTKDASIATSNPAPRITYTLTVVNNGPSDALNVVLTDPLPLDPKKIVYVFDTGNGACAYNLGSHTVTCNFGTLPSGASKSVNIIVDARGSVAVVTNTATVATSTTDPNLANNTATKQVRVKGGPGNGK